MPEQNIITGKSGRKFAASAVGLLAFIVREDERVLMLSHPKRPGKWEPPNGAFDGNETIIDGLMREIREEAGEDVRVRPLGAVHAYTFRYDPVLTHMISIAYLFAYEGGEVSPGDDMAGSGIAWLSTADIDSGTYDIIVPSQQPWMLHRAIELYRLWKDVPPVEQQPVWGESARNKYGE